MFHSAVQTFRHILYLTTHTHKSVRVLPNLSESHRLWGLPCLCEAGSAGTDYLPRWRLRWMCLLATLTSCQLEGETMVPLHFVILLFFILIVSVIAQKWTLINRIKCYESAKVLLLTSAFFAYIVPFHVTWFTYILLSRFHCIYFYQGKINVPL